MSRFSVWEKGEKIGRIVGAEREVPSYPLDRRPVHLTDPNDLHPYPILLKLQSHPNSACEQDHLRGELRGNFGLPQWRLNSSSKLFSNWHKLTCVTESLNSCSLRRFMSQVRQTQHFARSTRRGACRASLKIPRLSRLAQPLCCYSN